MALSSNAPACIAYITEDGAAIWTHDDCKALEMCRLMGHTYEPKDRKIISADAFGVIVKWNEGKSQTFYPWSSISHIVIPTHSVPAEGID